ncbi:unnamed protein product [Closterium sp. Naga37s-1]|nr:unnamed protein product [Closterium sp. Naga37s-1]
MSTAVQLVASNLKDVVAQINPTIADGIDSSIAVCDIFIGMTPCSQLLEDLIFVPIGEAKQSEFFSHNQCAMHHTALKGFDLIS